MKPRVAKVILDTRLPQLDKVLDYAIADDQVDAIRLGVRVRVPVRGSRLTAGYVVGLAESSEFDGRLQSIERVISSVPVLRPEVLELARAVAHRAAGNVSDILRLAIPPRQARQEHAGPWPDWPETSPEKPHEEGRRRVLDLPGGVTQLATGETVGTWATVLAETAAEQVKAGKQAILVVPDYRDQRQLEQALASVLAAEQIAQLDARQSAKERYRAFLATVSGNPMAIVGPRSTVYAPAANLGLIAVFDDGDPLHAEPLAPHVHTRDAALVRHALSGADLLFAAHARSVPVHRLVEIGYCTADEPAGTSGSRPRVHVAPSDDGTPHRIPSAAFRAVQQGLEHGPVLVQVAKPGTHTRVVCATCGSRAACTHCSGPLDPAADRPTCRWCSRLQPQFNCEHCQGTRLARVGSGSTRTAAQLGRAFPGHAVTVADGEHEVLTIDAKSRLVVATVGAAPIAEGGYRGVILLDGDAHLAGERLTVAEDFIRQSRNALALAASDAHCVITGATGAIATAVQTVSNTAYAAAELATRRQTFFPPAVRVASVLGDEQLVAGAVREVKAACGADTLGMTDVTGPDGDREVRAIIRFPYADGECVADELRAQILRAATRSRKSAGRLRVRMDDMTPFEGGA